jgi:hypothetical protein
MARRPLQLDSDEFTSGNPYEPGPVARRQSAALDVAFAGVADVEALSAQDFALRLDRAIALDESDAFRPEDGKE